MLNTLRKCIFHKTVNTKYNCFLSRTQIYNTHKTISANTMKASIIQKLTNTTEYCNQQGWLLPPIFKFSAKFVEINPPLIANSETNDDDSSRLGVSLEKTSKTDIEVQYLTTYKNGEYRLKTFCTSPYFRKNVRMYPHHKLD